MNIQYKVVEFEVGDQKNLDSLMLSLESKGERPLLRRMLNALTADAGVEKNLPVSILEAQNFWADDEGEQLLLGEIFVKKETLIVLQPKHSEIELWFFGGGSETEAEQFCTTLSAILELSPDFSQSQKITPIFQSRPVPSTVQSDIFDESEGNKHLETIPPDYTDQEVAASKCLAEDSVRTAILKLAQNVKIKAIDFKKIAAEPVIERMKQEGLVEEQFLVACKQDSGQLAVFDNLEGFKAGHAGALKCATCNRFFKDENIESIYTLSQFGKKLSDKSRWMSIFVTDILRGLNVPRESIKWNATASGDEIDIIVDIFGRSIFFELKDREFGQGDAYAFLFRCDRFKANAAMVVSMTTASPEAHSTFEFQKAVKDWKIVEGKRGELTGEIKKFIFMVRRKAIMTLFRRSTAAFGPDFSSLFQSWARKNGIWPTLRKSTTDRETAQQ
jgi:hypothetical protein